MARRPAWTELSTGLFATVGILAAAVLILVFGRVGQLHGEKYTIFVTTDAARGLIHGSEVWLDGRRIGSVEGIAFQPPSANRKNRLVLALHVLDETRSHIRRNSRVQVRAGLNLIGDQVVYLSSGTLDQPSISEGDTLHATEQTDMESVTSEAALAAKQFPGIIENVKILGAQLRSTEGTLGALGVDGGRLSLRPIRATTAALFASLRDSVGTLGHALHDGDKWRADALNALASVDSIRTLVASDRHSLGRFRRDSTLGPSVAAARRTLAALGNQLSNTNGTLGRLRTDSAIARSLASSRASLDSLMADMKRHPLRYIAF